MSPQDLVTEFHRAFDVAVNVPVAEVAPLRIRLLIEECHEALDALALRDLPAIAQELADLVYVAYGTAMSLGIDLDAALAEVHRANMAKLGPDGKPVLRFDGKVLKPDGWIPPDMTAALPCAAGVS